MQQPPNTSNYEHLSQRGYPIVTSAPRTTKMLVRADRHSIRDDDILKEQESEGELDATPLANAYDAECTPVVDLCASQANANTASSGPLVRLTRSALYRSCDEEVNHEENIREGHITISQAAEIVDFMRQAWKLPTPELIISITGGAKLFEIISAHAHRTFQQDLVSAAMATSKELLFSSTTSIQLQD